ncbi:MAG TPA: FMN-binding protein [Bacilli bacterium]|nr:MAG: FMN-binding domain protein [Tenericutes bacterium ADurb.BinA124]HPX84635.1 FMN-binding protein [Bacilli bacterium]HQC74296.1 FMN-binding protein [Bacilli bacterium]
MKKCLIALIVVIGIFMVMIIIAKSFSRQFNNLEIAAIDLKTLNDGEYIGYYKIFPISAKVKVLVANHEIQNIEILEHNNGQGKPAEAIIPIVISHQSLQVEIISGATYSSKVILKAIENALSD